MSPFNPDIHHRHSIRLPAFDYSTVGAYFITICTHQREHVFGEMLDENLHGTNSALMVQQAWDELPKFYPWIKIDTAIVMPDHFHGIIWIINPVGAGPRACPFPPRSNTAGNNNDRHENDRHEGQPNDRHEGQPQGVAPTLSDAVHRFKSITTYRYRQIQKATKKPHEIFPKLWQRNYYERIIRSEQELSSVRQYILENPANWDIDNSSDSWQR